MNGFEQIKSFYSWVFNNSDKVRPTHISLYLFLLNQNNRSMWVEWFKCPYDLAMQGACIGNKNTYYKCLDELQLYGLIIYQKGINNYKAPLIKLIQLYGNEPLTEQVTVPQSEQVTVPLTVPLTVPQYDTQTEPLCGLLNKNIYKLITNNFELLNTNEKLVTDFVDKLKQITKVDYKILLLEHGFEKNLIDEWFIVRENKNASNTKTFFQSFINEINNSGLDKNVALRTCVEQSWATFKKTWYDNLNKQNNGTPTKKSNVNYSPEFIEKHFGNLQP